MANTMASEKPRFGSKIAKKLQAWQKLPFKEKFLSVIKPVGYIALASSIIYGTKELIQNLKNPNPNEKNKITNVVKTDSTAETNIDPDTVANYNNYVKKQNPDSNNTGKTPPDTIPGNGYLAINTSGTNENVYSTDENTNDAGNVDYSQYAQYGNYYNNTAVEEAEANLADAKARVEKSFQDKKKSNEELLQEIQNFYKTTGKNPAEEFDWYEEWAKENNITQEDLDSK